MVLKVEDVFCSVFEFREKKRTFAKIERANVNFFLIRNGGWALGLARAGRFGRREGFVSEPK